MDSLKLKKIRCENVPITVIGSMHAEQNMFSRNEKRREICENIQEILQDVNPRTIFIETTKDKNISSYRDKSPLYSSVELIAISKYMYNKNVEVVKVDSKKCRDLYTKDASDDMVNFVHLLRNNPIAYNTYQYILDNKIKHNCALIIGRNHVDEVVNILSQ